MLMRCLHCWTPHVVGTEFNKGDLVGSYSKEYENSQCRFSPHKPEMCNLLNKHLTSLFSDENTPAPAGKFNDTSNLDLKFISTNEVTKEIFNIPWTKK